MSKDDVQDAQLGALKERFDRHEEHCERRQSATWTEMGVIRNKVDNLRGYILGTGILILAGEYGLADLIKGL